MYRVVREMLPRERFGPGELLSWLEGTQRAQRAGQPLSREAPRRPLLTPEHPSLNRRCNTRGASQNKTRQLIAEITLEPPSESLAGVSLDALIDSAQAALASKNSQGPDGLQKAFASVQERIDRLNEFYSVAEDIETKQSDLQNARLQLCEILGQGSLKDLREAVNKAREEVDTADLRRQVFENTLSLLDRDQGESVPCPVCETVYPRKDLESTLRHSADELSENSTTALIKLEDSLRQAEDLVTEESSNVNELDVLTQKGSRARDSLNLRMSRNCPS